jgi:hypothetical protein
MTAATGSRRKRAKRRSWIAIVQPRDADQFDPATMQVVDCWVSESDRKGATVEANERLAGWLVKWAPCKISLFEGDLTAQHFLSE